MNALRSLLPLILLALLGLPQAEADDAPLGRLLRSHDMAGYAFEARLPEGWRILRLGKRYLTLASADPKAKGVRYELTLNPIPLPDTAFEGERVARGETGMYAELDRKFAAETTWYRDQRVFHEGTRTLSGLSFHERHVGPPSVRKPDGASAKATSGVLRTYSTITPEAVRIVVRVNAFEGHTPTEIPMLTFEQLDVDAVLGSLRIRRVADLSPEERAQLPSRHETQTVRVSARRGYHLDLGGSFLLPAGWKVAAIVDEQAGPGAEKGVYAIQITPPAGPEGVQPLPVAILLFEGLTVGPQSKGQFLATLDARVKGVLPEGKLQSTEEIQHPGLSYLASLAPRRGSSTRATVVRTYVQTRSDGQSLVLKGYTAGGMTGAAHLILIAEGDRLDAFEASVAPILQTLRVSVDSPSIRFP